MCRIWIVSKKLFPMTKKSFFDWQPFLTQILLSPTSHLLAKFNFNWNQKNMRAVHKLSNTISGVMGFSLMVHHDIRLRLCGHWSLQITKHLLLSLWMVRMQHLEVVLGVKMWAYIQFQFGHPALLWKINFLILVNDF